jgi:hypothetical protein
MKKRLLDIMDGDEECIDSRLSAELINAFYQLMLQFEENEDCSMSFIRDWAKAFAAAKLKDAAHSARGLEKQKISAMTMVAIIVEFGANGIEDCVNDFHFIVHGFRMLLELEGQPPSVAAVWQTVLTRDQSLGELVPVTPLAVQRLVDYWSSDDNTISETDMNFIFTHVMPSQRFTIYNRMPMLETLLLGTSWRTIYHVLQSISAADSNGLLSVFDAFGSGRKFDVSELLEESLKVESPSKSDVYMPNWMTHRENDTLSPPAAAADDVFFLLVWKWLICVHESDTLKQLTLLTQKIRSSPALTSFPKQRAVALAAVHTRIIHQIAQRVACRSDDVTLFTDREEADCVLSVLETLSGDSEMSMWAKELAYGVVSQLSCRAEVAIEHLDAISTACQESNKIMSSWMRCAVEAVGAKPPLWLSQYRI